MTSAECVPLFCLGVCNPGNSITCPRSLFKCSDQKLAQKLLVVPIRRMSPNVSKIFCGALGIRTVPSFRFDPLDRPSQSLAPPRGGVSDRWQQWVKRRMQSHAGSTTNRSQSKGRGRRRPFHSHRTACPYSLPYAAKTGHFYLSATAFFCFRNAI